MLQLEVRKEEKKKRTTKIVYLFGQQWINAKSNWYFCFFNLLWLEMVSVNLELSSHRREYTKNKTEKFGAMTHECMSRAFFLQFRIVWAQEKQKGRYLESKTKQKGTKMSIYMTKKKGVKQRAIIIINIYTIKNQ